MDLGRNLFSNIKPFSGREGENLVAWSMLVTDLFDVRPFLWRAS